MTATTDHYFGIDIHKREAQVAVLEEIAQEYVGRSAALEAGSKTTVEIDRGGDRIGKRLTLGLVGPSWFYDRVGNPKAREIAPES